MTYAEAEADTKIVGSILPDGRGGRIMYLTFGEGSTRISFHVNDTMFLDKLANEAERLCREFVGDVPVAGEPLDLCEGSIR
jgi:hypothetical protein